MSSQIKVELQDSMGNDRAIAEAAWTSSIELQRKELKTDEDVKRILTTVLTKPIIEIEDALHQHASPFESVIFRFWIKMPIATDRQHMTHRIASHNGMSGRYRTMPNEYLEIPLDIKDILVKISDKYILVGDKPDSDPWDFMSNYKRICEEANDEYNSMIFWLKAAKNSHFIEDHEFKRLREFYRGILPQHNMTERVTLINLRSFANYQKLRNSEYAQPEIRQVAEMMLKSVRDANICPIAIEALERNLWVI